MKAKNATRWAFLVGTSLLTGNLAIAADNCTGYDNLVTLTTETLDLGNKHTLTVFRQTSALTSPDAAIWNLVTGECSGAALATPDGKVQALGYCLRRDKDGDTASIEWTLPPGAERSTWRVTGGTGKFAARSGSGWAETVRSDGKIEQVKWGGTCK
jgi:hypothetical protein